MIRVVKTEYIRAIVIEQETYILDGKDEEEYLESDEWGRRDKLAYCDYTSSNNWIDEYLDVNEVVLEHEVIRPACDMNFEGKK